MKNQNPRSPFFELRDALANCLAQEETDCGSDASIRADRNRKQRTGIPEIVQAENKSAVDVATALRELARANGRALASRVSTDDVAAIRSLLQPTLVVEEYAAARCLVASTPGANVRFGGGRVGVMSAGTADIPMASEAALMAAEMGADVSIAWDVGVAGLHRLVAPLERFAMRRVDAVVVAAGMDGALPAVVAGLVDVPVIGLPTSVGYGFGGGGSGALMTMLQSCAPGLVVVNIDNGIGAGSSAALIANRAGARRPSRAD